MGWAGIADMHDVHCHLDLYKDPLAVATSTEHSGVLTIAVTNLPSAYYAAEPHMRRFRYLKLAVGLHPLLTEHHTPQEKQLFQKAFAETNHVGEVGLDFSREGVGTKETQTASFRFVLDLLRRQHKVVTVHSRRAESTVLKLLSEFDVGPVIFHWYSGPLTVLDQIVEKGHYFSINSAMMRSKNGQRIINRIPREHLLTETDGPFVTVNKRPAVPADVHLVHEYLALRWQEPISSVVNQLTQNLAEYIDHVAT
jgi:TatD DNase family protein